jgi:prepilin-type N-terminal cleavage/methylation domain-containing protein
MVVQKRLQGFQFIMKFVIRSEKGFTLLEIIAVLVILSILAGIAIPRYISLDESAKQKGLDAAIAELNGRETLTWSNEKISVSGPKSSGGTITFKDSNAVTLTRAESTHEKPGSWSR